MRAKRRSSTTTTPTGCSTRAPVGTRRQVNSHSLWRGVRMLASPGGMGGWKRAGPPGDLRRILLPSLELGLGLAGCLAMLAGAAPLAVPEVKLTETAFLIGLVVFFGWFVVRLDRGHLRLTMIGTQAAAMILPPPLAGLVGLVAGVSWFRQGPRVHRYLGAGGKIF